MEHNTSRRHITVEEHVVTFGKMDIVEALDSELAGEGIMVAPRITRLCVAVGEETVVGPTRLLEMLRTAKEDIPEEAELVLAVRWRKEVSNAAVAARPGSLPRTAPPPVKTAGRCATCQGVPAIDGPTPDCEDEDGCGMVRAVKGELPIVQTEVPQGTANIGHGGGGRGANEPPPGVLVNRETGEKAFADRDGRPYGHHDDYEDR